MMKQKYLLLLSKIYLMYQLIIYRFFILSIYLILMIGILRLFPIINFQGIKIENYDGYSRVIILFLLITMTDNDNQLKILLRGDIFLNLVNVYSEESKVIKIFFIEFNHTYLYETSLVIKLISFLLCSFHFWNFETLILFLFYY